MSFRDVVIEKFAEVLIKENFELQFAVIISDLIDELNIRKEVEIKIKELQIHKA